MKAQRWHLAVVLATLFTLLVAGLVSAGGPPSGPPGLDRAIAAQEAHTDALLGRPGVVGTAVGLGADGRAVVKVYVESGRVSGLPSRLDGVPVEVEVTGELVAQDHTLSTSRTRPASVGTSTGSERLIISRGFFYCTVGTLAARVTDGVNVYALSNAHVYALEGSKTNGTVVAGPDGDRSLQPGRVDLTGQACGTPAEIDAAVIGRLSDYEPLDFSRKGQNTIDAAIASTSVDQVGTATPADGYGTPSSTTVPAALGQAVQKYGRTTDLTTGTVTGVNATVMIRYGKGRAKFVNQIIITGSSGAFSDGGDSGSLVVTQGGNHPVGLLFAGSSTSTIANPIDAVLARFGVTIDGGP